MAGGAWGPQGPPALGPVFQPRTVRHLVWKRGDGLIIQGDPSCRAPILLVRAALHQIHVPQATKHPISVRSMKTCSSVGCPNHGVRRPPTASIGLICRCNLAWRSSAHISITAC
ncbi:hypothetical protein XFF6994_1990007 [Xanthomonas citri pv. fuscans]|nr:hypothetical protein XFF6994_1990007 [Xanthomonas citri pv. fuscans]